MKIGIDVMGGDHAPEAIVSGAVLASRELSASAKIILIGDKEIASSEFKIFVDPEQ